ncbi:MAG: 3-deoxy-7-phosphoheptulonate synthase [Acidobacteria bacterium]|nr:3-deoxy-7-phosphoheptulonate synthase [Acidobacteriota bacterium]
MNIKLAAKNKESQRAVRVGGLEFGRDFVLAAGPCSVESEEQMAAIARAVSEAGANLLRGGAFKPRTSPYAFQGLGLAGLKILQRAGREMGLPVVTEVLDARDVPWVADYADMLQIGARNMQNFSLLKEVGRAGRPVLLKRGMNATLAEWLSCAEYILHYGNPDVVLCERGIRTFETHTRNTLDLSAVPALHQLTHLPVMVDPSHGTGRRELIPAMTLAAVAAGADAVMLEVHHQPDRALSDGDQALLPAEFARLVRRIQVLRDALRQLPDIPPDPLAGGTGPNPENKEEVTP